MSGVYARNRKPTRCDYVDAAWELRKHTLHICTRFPERYRKWITDDIVMFTKKCHEYAFSANCIIPKYREDAEKRMKYLETALISIENVYPQIELAHEMFKFDRTEGGKSNEQLLKIWLPEIERTENLIKAIMASDKKRYANLPFRPKSDEDVKKLKEQEKQKN